MSDCDSFAGDAVLLVANELGAERRRSLEAHLETCADCSAMVEELVHAHEALHSREVGRMPAALRHRLMGSVHPRRFPSRLASLVPAAAAACAVLVLWIGGRGKPLDGPPPVGPPTSVDDAASVEVLGDEGLADLANHIFDLSRAGVARAIPSTALTLVGGRGNPDEDDLMSSPWSTSERAGVDRELRSLAQRIRDLDKDAWYLSPPRKDGSPSSGVGRENRVRFG